VAKEVKKIFGCVDGMMKVKPKHSLGEGSDKLEPEWKQL